MRIFSEYSHGEQVQVLDSVRQALQRERDDLQFLLHNREDEVGALRYAILAEGPEAYRRIMRRADRILSQHAKPAANAK